MEQKNLCKAELLIGDDNGDNYATMICQLRDGHDGNHMEEYPHNNNRHEMVKVTWITDDRKAQS